MIFGIRLGRTGTRSLTEAIRMMRLNAGHWDNLGSSNAVFSVPGCANRTAVEWTCVWGR
jgi:hypothetical protein